MLILITFILLIKNNEKKNLNKKFKIDSIYLIFYNFPD